MTRRVPLGDDHPVTAVAPRSPLAGRDLFRPAPEEEPGFTDDAWAPAAMPTVPRADRAPRPRAAAAPGYAVTPWGPAPVGRAMKRRAPLAAWLGLPLLTLGIYPLVWYGLVHREMAAFDRRERRPVLGPVLVVVLLGWTVVAPLMSFAATGRRIRAAQDAAGMAPTCRPGLGVVLLLVLGAGLAYYQGELNKVVDAYDARPGVPVALRE